MSVLLCPCSLGSWHEPCPFNCVSARTSVMDFGTVASVLRGHHFDQRVYRGGAALLHLWKQHTSRSLRCLGWQPCFCTKNCSSATPVLHYFSLLETVAQIEAQFLPEGWLASHIKHLSPLLSVLNRAGRHSSQNACSLINRQGPVASQFSCTVLSPWYHNPSVPDNASSTALRLSGITITVKPSLNWNVACCHHN